MYVISFYNCGKWNQMEILCTDFFKQYFHTVLKIVYMQVFVQIV